jgi:hypothetical protein
VFTYSYDCGAAVLFINQIRKANHPEETDSFGDKQNLVMATRRGGLVASRLRSTRTAGGTEKAGLSEGAPEPGRFQSMWCHGANATPHS